MMNMRRSCDYFSTRGPVDVINEQSLFKVNLKTFSIILPECVRRRSLCKVPRNLL